MNCGRVLFLLFVLCVAGCGTLGNVVVFESAPAGFDYDREEVPPPPLEVYGGVRRDIDILKQQAPNPHFWTAATMALDIPLSAIGDTLTLPRTIPAALGRQNARAINAE